jgi:hypothetical protein
MRINSFRLQKSYLRKTKVDIPARELAGLERLMEFRCKRLFRPHKKCLQLSNECN